MRFLRKHFRLILVLLLSAGAAGTFGVLKGKKQGDGKYHEVQAKRGRLVVTILSTGTVQPENRLEIKPPIPGRVEQVLVEEGQPVRRGQILAWMSSTERAALLDAAQSEGPESVKRWEAMYKPTPVLAPITGTIILRSSEPGQTFTAADSVLVMSDRLTVKAQVDETDISQIKLHEKADIVLDAYPKSKIEAEVDHLAYDAKTVNNVTTYVVDVLPKALPDFMRSGMTANVTFYIDSKNDALLIPTEAIKVQDGQPIVLVPGPEGQALPKEITIGLTDGKQSEIVSGLEAGDAVLIPQIRPKEAQGKNPFSPMGNRPRGTGH